MTTKKSLPRLTLNVAVRDEGKRIATLLDSIAKQTYPKSRLEVLIVDGMSTDRTVEVVNEYSENLGVPIRVIKNPKRDSATGRTMGLLSATGDLHLYLDADMELSEATTLEKLVNPLVRDQEIVGSFTRFLPHPSDTPLNRFLSYSPFQHDPMIEFLSTNVEDTIHERHRDYCECIFKSGFIPVVGVVLFRTEPLRRAYLEIKKKWPNWMWSDVDLPIAIARKGFEKFAYVMDTGIYHHSYVDLSALLKKKKRDVTWSYLSTYANRYATYISLDSKKDVLRLIGFVLYSESLLLPLLRGIYKAMRFGDLCCVVYEPLLSWGLTNYILSLLILDVRGRKFLFRLLSNLVLK